MLILRELTVDDEAEFLLGYEDWKDDDLEWYTFTWTPGMDHKTHLQLLEDQKFKEKIPANRVPSTMLYGFVDGQIVGRLSIRHELNDFLLRRGGHAGYSVSPRHRNKGYATEMFRQGVSYFKKLGLSRVLITCLDQNIASWKIIERFGGSLENRIFDEEENEGFIRRYWIDLNAPLHHSAQPVDKAVAYMTREKNSQVQLLVFDHDEKYSDAGTQVICGTVDSGEDPLDTIFREIKEESGLELTCAAEKFDQYQFFSVHAQKFLRRHVFHFHLTDPTPEKWTHIVNGHGNDDGLNFHYFWINLTEAKGRLSGRFDDSVDLLIRKLGTTGLSKN
jgi:predicted acetyltransferase/8-oxo-dGTP pyrophosphatase MutT (NUDIX family)